MNEEKVEHILDVHDKRLNDHSGRLDTLEKSESAMTERVKNLCEKIESQTKTLNALIGVMAAGLVGFFFYAVQAGIF